jgi:xanthosine utilization system XapX-like protein
MVSFQEMRNNLLILLAGGFIGNAAAILTDNLIPIPSYPIWAAPLMFIIGLIIAVKIIPLNMQITKEASS